MGQIRKFCGTLTGNWRTRGAYLNVRGTYSNVEGETNLLRSFEIEFLTKSNASSSVEFGAHKKHQELEHCTRLHHLKIIIIPKYSPLILKNHTVEKMDIYHIFLGENDTLYAVYQRSIMLVVENRKYSFLTCSV